MSDSATETVDPDRLPDSDPRTLSVAPTSGGLSVGQRWGDLLIESEWPAGGPQCFVAEHAGSSKKVLVRACPIVASTEWRRGAWERLCALPDLQTIRSLSAEEESGWRYEISALPPPMTLREWLACHRPAVEEIESMVRQIATTLGALHGQGVVHLNIRPESIHIDESGAEPVFLLGGLQDATLYTRPELMASEVDPFYAPPEAAGVERHPPGTRMCAWDWWSTGRVVQEFFLGRHVLGLVLDRDVSRITPELRNKAELLLLEREPTGVRAGALEYMTMETRLTPLMRGLLTGSFEARWGLDAVQRWLRNEPVREHYDLPRGARLWGLRGRGFTVAEAAEYFTQAEHWEEGEDMLFQLERPETLGAFLRDSPAHREDFARFQAVCDLTETAAWGEVPVVARRTVTAALAWLALCNGSGVRSTFRIRGRSVDVVGLAELLRELGPSAGVAIFTALLTPVVINFVETLDAPAARSLKAIAAKGAEAVQHGAQHGWLDPHDVDAHAHIMELALKAGALLRDRIDLLRSLYATNSNAALAAVLAEKTPGPRDVVILAFTAEKPQHHGFITHEEWRRQRCDAIKAEAERVITVLFWVRARHLLAATRIWGAPTPHFAVIVLVLTLLAVWLARSAGPAALVAGIWLLSRGYFWWRMRSMVRTFDRAAASWSWTDGLIRVEQEAERAAQSLKLSPAQLPGELARLQSAMTALAKKSESSSAIVQPRWQDLWLVVSGGILATLALFSLLVVRQRPQSEDTTEAAPSVNAVEQRVPGAESVGEPVVALTESVKPGVDVDALLATGRYELIDDGFGRQIRGPLLKWTFYADGVVEPLDIVARARASSEQSAFALVNGALLLHPYPRQGINVYLAVRVPTDGGFGFLIYNARDRKLLDQEVVVVREPLKENTWYQFGSRRIGYLGTPAALQAEISLAPP